MIAVVLARLALAAGNAKQDKLLKYLNDKTQRFILARLNFCFVRFGRVCLWALVVGAVPAQQSLAQLAPSQDGPLKEMKQIPQRVVSLNLCTDELLLALAEPHQIQSVTWLVKDPSLSWMASAAQAYPSNQGAAEEVLAFAPDLVLAGAFTAPATLVMLERLGIPVIKLNPPKTVAAIKLQVQQVANLLGRADYGRRLIRAMEHDIANLPPLATDASGLRALLYQPNGLTAGGDTLVADIMRVAGLENLAQLRNYPIFTQLPLEVLVLERPDLLILGEYMPQLPSLAQALLTHPVLRQSFIGHKTIVVPSQSWSCGVPHAVEAIKILRHAAIAAAKV